MDDRKDKNENEENESDFWSDALDDIMRRRAWKEWLGEMFDMVMCVMIAAGFTVAPLTRSSVPKRSTMGLRKLVRNMRMKVSVKGIFCGIFSR